MQAEAAGWQPPPVARFAVAALLFLGLLAGATGGWLSAPEALAWTFGGLFGFVLQRARFCFFCNLRDCLEDRVAGGAYALLAALAAGLVGYHLVTSAWVLDPAAGYLPAKAHIAPAGWHLLLGGLAFGLGMSLSGSCLSGHLYRLGEGSLTSLLALPAAAAGFGLGFLAWRPLYLRVISEAPIVWLPAKWGYPLALLAGLAALAGLALLIWHFRDDRTAATAARPQTLSAVAGAVFVRRWPPLLGGLAVGLLGTAALLRSQPLGVTAELGSVARRLATGAGWLPAKLEGLDAFRGCATAAPAGLLGLNGWFVLALIAAAFAAALLAGDFAWKWPGGRALIGAVVGGVLLGFGAMISLGCSVGTLLSGIMASSLSGWIFLVAMVAGVWLGLPLRLALSRSATAG